MFVIVDLNYRKSLLRFKSFYQPRKPKASIWFVGEWCEPKEMEPRMVLFGWTEKEGKAML